MILGLPAVAPCGTHHPAGWWHCRGTCRRSLQKVPRPLPASSPTLAILLGQILRHPCQGVTKTPYLCTHPWHPTKWLVNGQQSPPLYTWRKKKWPNLIFVSLQGNRVIFFRTALRRRACRAHGVYAVPWARLFFRMRRAASFALLTSPLLWTVQASYCAICPVCHFW